MTEKTRLKIHATRQLQKYGRCELTQEAHDGICYYVTRQETFKKLRPTLLFIDENWDDFYQIHLSNSLL